MLVAAAVALLVLALPSFAGAAVTAPHNVITFPQRDFVSADGYLVADRYTVEVLHPNSPIPVGTVTGITPVEDPATPGRGLIEVNHPGGACWVGTTPDIRAGDTIRILDETTGTVDTSIVRNVTAQRPVQIDASTVQVHGTAQDAAGNPLPVAQIEQRMVAPRDAFLLNGRRTLRATSAAGSDGTLAYDPVGPDNPNGTKWTATYTGLAAADVTRALGAESRGIWLDPAVPSTESTIFENGAGAIPGPAAPCTAPLEMLPPPPGTELIPPTTPDGLTATVSTGNTVALSWNPATDNVGVVDYGIYRDGVEIATVQSADGVTPPLTAFTDRNVPPGAYTYTVDAGDAVGNRSGMSTAVSVETTRPSASLPAGTTVNDPPAAPVQIISFPSRDFISSTGFLATDTVAVQVLRREGGQLVLVSSATQIPQADPKAGPADPFAGLVEVNHPGGACWDGTTPDIRAGDIVRTIAYRPDGTIRTVDETRTANAVTQRPVVAQEASAGASDGIIEVHGEAMDANGDPLPVDQIEQRLVANRDAFDLNGRRTIRAGGAGKDGTLTYDANDPTGTHWTARYTGLDANDVSRAVGRAPFPGAQSRVLWLGSQPLAALELTIYENDGATSVVNGPSAPCTAPQEPLDTIAPAFADAQPLTAAQVAGTADVRLDWTAATDAVDVVGYRIYRDGQPVRNVGGSASTFTDHNVVGTHTYAIDATDAASPGVGGNGQGSPWGNRSARTTPVSVTATDVTAPGVPTGVAATTAPGTVTLNWTASKDDVGVTAYGVYRDGTLVGTVKNADGSAPAPTTFTESGLATGTYSYTVDAVDAAANRSAKSDPAIANVTGVPDTTAPSVPGGLAADTPDVHVRDVKVTWTASTDDVGVTGYGVYRRRIDPSAATQPAFAKIADAGATATSYTDSAVPAGTYEYTVDAADSAGNRSAKPAAKTVVVANDPPAGSHQMIAFPARDFLSTTGYAPNTPYSFAVIRNNKVFATSSTATSDATGVVEVNHPGGACWNTVTPNIVPGDVVRIMGPDGVAEQTTVAKITADRPMVTSVDPVTGGGTVEVHGTADDGTGHQIPVDQIEQRLVANRDAFDLNGRRTVRAGGAGTDGTLTYDSATSTRWTVKYTFGTPDDLARAAGGTSTSGRVFTGSESRLMWLGRAPLAGNEQTIYENGPGVVGGPAGVTGCVEGAPETPVPGASLSAAPTFPQTTLGATSAAQTVTLTNSGGAPLHVDRAYIAGLNPGDFTITANGASGATVPAGGSVTVSVAFKPTASGTRQANLSFTDDAANTTDQSVALVGSTPSAANPTATAPVQALAAVTDPISVLSPLSASTIPVDIKWSGTGGSYQLQMASGSSLASVGKWTDVPLTAASATSTRISLAMGNVTGNAYQFQVRSCTGAVCGAWAQGPKFTLVPSDEAGMAPGQFKGTWTNVPLAGTYGGSVRRSSTSAQATIVPAVTFTVSGNAAWVSTRGPDQGLAQVQVDNGTPQVVDMYASSVQTGQIVWAKDALAAGVHTVTVTVLGKKSPLNPGACNTVAKCSQVDIDMAAIIK